MLKHILTKAEWDEVGLKALDEFTLEFTFVNDMTEWDVKYWLTSFVTTPINLHLYEALKNDEGKSSYGTDEKSIVYTGPYYIEYYEHDKEIRLAKMRSSIPQIYTNMTKLNIQLFQTKLDSKSLKMVN